MGDSIPEWVYDSYASEGELENLQSIQQENFEEFEKLKNSIKESAVFKQCCGDMVNAECKKMIVKYQEEKNKRLSSKEEFNNGYNMLVKQENEINKKKYEVKKAIKKLDLEYAKTESKQINIDKLKSGELTTLFGNALRQYEDTFGFDVKIMEVDDDTFWAVFTLKNKDKYFIKFLINKVSNKVSGIETTCENSENMEDKIQDLKCRLLLISDLRKLSLN